jgi:hypothetical protein
MALRAACDAAKSGLENGPGGRLFAVLLLWDVFQPIDDVAVELFFFLEERCAS